MCLKMIGKRWRCLRAVRWEFACGQSVYRWQIETLLYHVRCEIGLIIRTPCRNVPGRRIKFVWSADCSADRTFEARLAVEFRGPYAHVNISILNKNLPYHHLALEDRIIGKPFWWNEADGGGQWWIQYRITVTRENCAPHT